MNSIAASQKKRSKGTLQYWHGVDSAAALHKRGISLEQLSRNQGLASRTLNNASELHYPKAESTIAQALNIAPEQLWPGRYTGKSPEGTEFTDDKKQI